MSIQDMVFRGSGVLVIVFTLIQVTPLKVNPWSWIGKKIGRALTGEVLEKLEEQDKKINELRETQQELRDDQKKEHDARRVADIEDNRRRILRFADEISCKQLHSREHYNQIIEDIDEYENYCERHKNFKNSKAITSIQIIREVYQRHLNNNDFLDNLIRIKVDKEEDEG